jgi:type III pantothenate kinase
LNDNRNDITIDLGLSRYWLALTIGNSRLHWGLFQHQNLINFGDSSHLSHQSDRKIFLQQLGDRFAARQSRDRNLDNLTIYLASVLPKQTRLWSNYPQLKQITLRDIPLNNLYPTLGIDRALAVWGAGHKYGFPCLVIDGGTALTFTAVDGGRNLVGGAIVPGLRSQLTALSKKTAALPEINLPTHLPSRWALNTEDAIASGIVYGAIAIINDFINHWYDLFPDSTVILTGGDGKLLYEYLRDRQLLTSDIAFDPHLIFWGMESVRSKE